MDRVRALLEAVAGLIPSRLRWLAKIRREAQAQALYDAADEIGSLYFGPDRIGQAHAWGAKQAAVRVRARADRLTTEGTD
jgi:hypothetical protein